jgi:OOP family OmpA-OmpF porin
MTKSFGKKQIGLALACALAMGILSGTAAAQSATMPPMQPDGAKDKLYVVDSGTDVVTSGFGLCWHSGFGPPPAPSAKCEPRAVAYVAPPVMKSEPVPPPAMVEPPVVAGAPEPPPQAAEPPKVYEPPQRPARLDRN